MANINIDFSEVDSPTAKQIDFLQEICQTLGLEKPEEYTRESYSNFIDQNVELYYYTLNSQRSDYW